MSYRFAGPVLAAAVAVVALSGAARAENNIMTVCGGEYQAAKTANTLGGKTWNQYLAECRTRHAAQPATAAPAAAPAAPAAATTTANPLKPAPATTAAPAAPAAATAAKPAADKPATDGRQAMLARERACGAEWKEKKVELRKADPKLKWPQFWSECNTRLKAAGK
jgi:hypothetical protein